MIPQLTADEIVRFHLKIRRGPGCHEWTGETNNKGYGRFTIYRDGRRIRILAHRLAYALATGTDPGDAKMRHRCDNPPCCNPADLLPGSQADNIRDAIARGRLNTAGLQTYRDERDAAAYALLAEGKKRCYGCKRNLPLDAFHRCRSGFAGLAQECKGCCADNQRAYRNQYIGVIGASA